MNLTTNKFLQHVDGDVDGPSHSRDSPAKLSFALLGQGVTCATDSRPILAGVAIGNDVKQILEVHVRNASKPMHQSLDVWDAAGFQALLLEETQEEGLRFRWAAQRCDRLEA